MNDSTFAGKDISRPWTPGDVVSLMSNVVETRSLTFRDSDVLFLRRTAKNCRNKLKNEKRRMIEYGWDHDWKSMLIAAILEYVTNKTFNFKDIITIKAGIKAILSSIKFALLNTNPKDNISFYEIRCKIGRMFKGKGHLQYFPSSLFNEHDVCADDNYMPQEPEFNWSSVIVFGMPEALVGLNGK